MINCDCFADFKYEQMACKVIYDVDHYLNLVSTLRKIDLQIKEPLFIRLREKLHSFGGNIELSFLSAVHIARKNI